MNRLVFIASPEVDSLMTGHHCTATATFDLVVGMAGDAAALCAVPSIYLIDKQFFA
jgi:hypothetical protein